ENYRSSVLSLKAYEHNNGPVNASIDFLSPRDHDGHGSHTASTAAGREVHNASSLGGIASGTASGGAPLARVAMYKVCWPLNGTLENGNSCEDADMLAAIDDAIGDGVNVLSISIGPDELIEYTEDFIAMGALHAVKNNIVVSVAAGNDGPGPATGQTVTLEKLQKNKMYPLVYAGDVVEPHVLAKFRG
ncbi:Subtilisin-like protease SBT5.6, partial [Thalictrum thalictroides]